VLETVIPVTPNAESGGLPTGIFFLEQTPEDLIRAVQLYQKMQSRFDPKKIRDRAVQFSAQRFKNQIHEYIQARLSER
jgi:hypothetical protein